MVSSVYLRGGGGGEWFQVYIDNIRRQEAWFLVYIVLSLTEPLRGMNYIFLWLSSRSRGNLEILPFHFFSNYLHSPPTLNLPFSLLFSILKFLWSFSLSILPLPFSPSWSVISLLHYPLRTFYYILYYLSWTLFALLNHPSWTFSALLHHSSWALLCSPLLSVMNLICSS